MARLHAQGLTGRDTLSWIEKTTRRDTACRVSRSQAERPAKPYFAVNLVMSSEWSFFSSPCTRWLYSSTLEE